MLGGTLYKLDDLDWRCCLLGVSVQASGGDNFLNREAALRWPWINGQFHVPDLLEHHGICSSATDIISCLAIRVKRGQITFEQAVDWVRSVEPAEPAETPETAPTETLQAVGNQ